MGLVVRNERFAELFEGASEDVGAGLTGEVEVEVEVVDGDEAEAEDFLCFDEVAEVGAGKVAAGVAFATRFDGGGVFSEWGVFEVQCAGGGKGGAVAGEASGEDAVEHVNAACDHFDDLRRGAEAHGVAGVVMREEGNSIFNGAEHLVFGFTDADAANGVAVESDVHEGASTFLAEIGVGGPLNDAEDERAVFGGLCVPPFPAAHRPAEREIEALSSVFVAAWMWGTLIEEHDDVGAQIALDFHGGFGANEGGCAVEVVLEMDALLGDLA